MPEAKGAIYRQSNGQYVWLYFREDVFIEVGGVNVANLNSAFNAVRDKIGLEPGIAQTIKITLIALIPPEFKGIIYREPDAQFSWAYFQDGAFVKFGGSNIVGLNTAINAVRDQIALESGIGNAKIVTLAAEIP